MIKRSIAQLDLYALHAPHEEEYLSAIRRVIQKNAFIGGDEVSGFESEFATWVGGGGAVVGCANGTDAITLAALALDLPPGSEAIVPAMTFFATIEGLLHAGLTVRLVDVDARTGLLDPEQLQASIGLRTKLIVPVHLYGQMARMDRIRSIADRHGCAVLEDASQAQGARFQDKPVGYFGDVATYSFYPGKNLGAFGDAGAVQSRNAALLERIRLLRNHGSQKRYAHEIVGYNSRLDGIQAAILRVKLNYLRDWNETRRRMARLYDDLLLDVPGLVLPTETGSAFHVYHQYVVRVQARERFMRSLQERGVETSIHYPAALHQLQWRVAPGGASLPESERLAAECVSLPMSPTLVEDDVRYVAGVIRDFFATQAS